MVREHCDRGPLHPAALQPCQRRFATRITPHCAHQPRFGTQCGSVQGDVGGRAAEVLTVREHVPEHLACANDHRP